MSNACVITATNTSGQTAGSPITIETGGDVVFKAFGTGTGAWSATLAFVPVVGGVNQPPTLLTISSTQPRAVGSAMGASATQWVGYVADSSGTWEASGIVEGFQPNEALDGDLGDFGAGPAPTKAVKANACATVNGQQVQWGGAGVGWGRSSRITIQGPLRMATIGDSTAMVAPLNRLDFESLAPVSPAPGTTDIVSYQAMGAAALLRRGRRLVAHGGIGGQATSEMLARSGSAWQFTTATTLANSGATLIAVSAIPWGLKSGTKLQFGAVTATLTDAANPGATSITVSALSGPISSGTTGGNIGMRRSLGDVYAKNPHVVCCLAGSINNLKNATSATVDAVVAANVADHKIIVEYYTSRGIHVVDPGTLGYLQTTNPNYQYILQAVAKSNAQLKALSQNNALWHFIDVVGHLSEASGAYYPACTDDLVHLSNYGGGVLDALESNVIDNLFDVTPEISGNVLFDQQPNFYQQASNLPKNCLDVLTGNITASNKSCNSNIYTCKLTVADSSAPQYNFFWYTNVPTDMLAAVKAGDHYTFDLDYTVKDASGNLVSGPGWKEGFTFTQKIDASTGLIYEIAYGQIPNAPRSIPCYSPIDGALLNSASFARLTLFFPTPGEYTLELKPVVLRKFVPLNEIGQTKL